MTKLHLQFYNSTNCNDNIKIVNGIMNESNVRKISISNKFLYG